MQTETTRIKEIAGEHMQRDVAETRTWSCECEACREWRSLVGLEKVLNVRPLVRDIRDLEDQLQDMPAGPDLESMKQRYLALYDNLADLMAK